MDISKVQTLLTKTNSKLLSLALLAGSLWPDLATVATKPERFPHIQPAFHTLSSPLCLVCFPSLDPLEDGQLPLLFRALASARDIRVEFTFHAARFRLAVNLVIEFTERGGGRFGDEHVPVEFFLAGCALRGGGGAGGGDRGSGGGEVGRVLLGVFGDAGFAFPARSLSRVLVGLCSESAGKVIKGKTHRHQA